MPPPLPTLLAARLLLAPASTEPPPGDAAQAPSVEGEQPASEAASPHLRVETDRVQAPAVEQGLELRVGEGWHRWTIEVRDGVMANQVQVTLHDDTGRTHGRELTLDGSTADERSRELATSLALLVEQLEPVQAQPTDPPTEHEPPTDPIAGFVGLGPRLALDAGRAPTIDAGLSLAGGAWLARDHVQPMAELSWARSVAGELRLDALRMGAGVLGGAAGLRGRIWGGGGVLVRAQWARATAEGAAQRWGASPALVGAVQHRGRILVLGAWVGTDLVLPPLVARGDAHELRWAPVRLMATLHVALRLPPSPRRASEPAT